MPDQSEAHPTTSRPFCLGLHPPRCAPTPSSTNTSPRARSPAPPGSCAPQPHTHTHTPASLDSRTLSLPLSLARARSRSYTHKHTHRLRRIHERPGSSGRAKIVDEPLLIQLMLGDLPSVWRRVERCCVSVILHMSITGLFHRALLAAPAHSFSFFFRQHLPTPHEHVVWRRQFEHGVVPGLMSG
jgi:hypothetical protein